MALEIKRPIELAGLKSRLLRAKNQELAIANVGQRYDKIQDAIDEKIDAAKGHVGHLEGYEAELHKTIEGMIGDNGDPTTGQDIPPGQDKIEQK